MRQKAQLLGIDCADELWQAWRITCKSISDPGDTRPLHHIWNAYVASLDLIELLHEADCTQRVAA